MHSYITVVSNDAIYLHVRFLLIKLTEYVVLRSNVFICGI